MKFAITLVLITGLALPAHAQDLRKRASDAAQSESEDAARPQTLTAKPGKNATFWAGTAMFVGGLGVGLYGFINDKNGKFAEFGEASSENKHLGAAGLGIAFGGGALMFVGMHQSRVAKAAPSITVGPHAVAVSKRVSW
jgi:hypothetical protein